MEHSTPFCVEFNDDAMAPKFPRGTRAFFTPTTYAGDRCVVIVEHEGRRMVRFLRHGPKGREAAALNPAFRELQQFRVEAVMCMVQQSCI
jgi:hypothetical protein